MVDCGGQQRSPCFLTCRIRYGRKIKIGFPLGSVLKGRPVDVFVLLSIIVQGMRMLLNFGAGFSAQMGESTEFQLLKKSERESWKTSSQRASSMRCVRLFSVETHDLIYLGLGRLGSTLEKNWHAIADDVSTNCRRKRLRSDRRMRPWKRSRMVTFDILSNPHAHRKR